MKLAKVGREKQRQRDNRAVPMSQFFLCFHEDVPVGLRDMRTEHTFQVVSAGISIAL